MKHNFFSHRLPGLLALLFVMTMILCSLYVPVSAAESDPTVSGLWIFNFDSYPATPTAIIANVNFTSDGQSFGRLYFGTGDLSYYTANSVPTTACTNSGWSNLNFKIVDFGEVPQTVSAGFYERLIAVASPYVPPKPVNLLDVFSFFASSLVSLFSSLILLFYTAESGLTFLGVLAVAALAISVALLIFTLISRWLKLRG